MPKCFICGSPKVICGVRGFHFCVDHQVEADRMFEKYEGTTEEDGSMELRLKSIFEAQALYEAIETRLTDLKNEQERDYLLSIRSRIEELIRVEKAKI